MNVYKYVLALQGEQSVTIPHGSKVLAVKVGGERDNQQLWLYCLVNLMNRQTKLRVRIAGTGHEIDTKGLVYRDTCMMESGLVWHVFTGVDEC